MDQIDTFDAKGVSRFSANTRIGFWNEEITIQEEKLKIFLRKRERGELLVQKTRKLFSNLLREISLSEPHPYVRFGDVVQLVAPDMPANRSGAGDKLGLSLAGLVGEKEVDCVQHFVEGCLVTCSPLLTPCVRNTFVINSGDCFDRTGEALKFGQAFHLCPVENLTGTALYVTAEPPQVSELGVSKHPLLRFSSNRNTYCRWRALYWHPAQRFETEGAPVPPNFRVVINHVPSNRNLGVEFHNWFQTYFGMECEVALHTYKDVHRRETSENMWMIIQQKSRDLIQVANPDGSPKKKEQSEPATDAKQDSVVHMDPQYCAPPKTTKANQEAELCQQQYQPIRETCPQLCPQNQPDQMIYPAVDFHQNQPMKISQAAAGCYDSQPIQMDHEAVGIQQDQPVMRMNNSAEFSQQMASS